jgi:hypothetical protein
MRCSKAVINFLPAVPFGKPAYIGILHQFVFVTGRSGTLLVFDFLQEQSAATKKTKPIIVLLKPAI